MKKRYFKNVKKENNNTEQVKAIITDYEANMIIANNLIDIIEKQDYDMWRKTWRCCNTLTDLYYAVLDNEIPCNAFDCRIYDFMNTLVFNIPAGFYCEMKQLKSRGLHLKKGAKGIQTWQPKYFYKHLTQQEENYILNDPELNKLYQNLFKNHYASFQATFTYIEENTQEEKTFNETICWDDFKEKPAYTRAQYVLTYIFNINDLDKKIDVAKMWKVEARKKLLTEAERMQKIQTTIDSYISRSKIKFQEVFNDKAFYRPADHLVNMPKFTQFEKPEEYYQVLFHEFSHSTGHYTLLNRKTLMDNCGFRSKTYAKEELVAELSSLYVLDNLKLITENIFKNTASYLASWGQKLKEGIKHNIINTIFHSTKAAELILDKSLKTKKTNISKEEIIIKEENNTPEENNQITSGEVVKPIEESKPAENSIAEAIQQQVKEKLTKKFSNNDNKIKRDLSPKEMTKKAVSAHLKTTKRKYVLQKSTAFDNYQVITNSMYLVMLDSKHVAPIELATEEENYPNLKQIINNSIYQDKQYDTVSKVNALEVRQAAKDKKHVFVISKDLKLAVDPAQLETILNFTHVKNAENISICSTCGVHNRPLMILDINNNKAILMPLGWSEDFEKEEEHACKLD